MQFESYGFIKNVIFWGISCWCSSKFDIVWGGTHKLQSQLLSPPLETQFLSYINMMYLKRSHFLCRWSIQTAKFNFVFEKTKKKSIFCFALIHIGALCSKTLEHFWQALEWSYQKNFCIFPNIIFQKILNLAEKVAKYQVCHFCQIWITLPDACMSQSFSKRYTINS